MSKIMSVLEKLRVVEKAKVEPPKATRKTNNKTVNHVNSQKPYVEQEQAQVDVKISKPVAKGEPKIGQDKSKYEKNMTIEEIYSTYSIENSNVNTVFMLGNFINALPENLPHEIRKYSIMNIINASNADLNELLTDGKKRLDILDQFSNDYVNATNNTTKKYREEIIKLKQMIDYYEGQIQMKESMLEEQSNVIKYETQRINNIFSFFKKGE